MLTLPYKQANKDTKKNKNTDKDSEIKFVDRPQKKSK